MRRLVFPTNGGGGDHYCTCELGCGSFWFLVWQALRTNKTTSSCSSRNQTTTKQQDYGASVPAMAMSTTSKVGEEADVCCQEWRESTQAFIKAVHNDAEVVSLARWTKSDFTPWDIPRLDIELLYEAFGNKKIALLGDSTLFQMLQRLHRLLTMQDPTYLGSVSDAMGLTQATSAIDVTISLTGSDTRRTADRLLHRNGDVLNYTNPSGNGDEATSIMWAGFRGLNMGDNCRFEQLAFPHVRTMKPDIIVANWGSHLLHQGGPNKPLCNIHQFLHYEEWLQSVLDLAMEGGGQAKLLLFKTTNFICRSRYPDFLQVGLANWDQNPPVFLAKCNEWLRLRNSDPPDGVFFNFTQAEMDRYCMEGAGLDVNVQKLNNRMQQFVVQARQNPSLKESGLQIEMFNDHDMESCHYTGKGDGFHYTTLQLPRIRMLAHMTKCLLKE